MRDKSRPAGIERARDGQEPSSRRKSGTALSDRRRANLLGIGACVVPPEGEHRGSTPRFRRGYPLNFADPPLSFASVAFVTLVAAIARASAGTSGAAIGDAATQELASLLERWARNGSGASGPRNYAETSEFLQDGKTMAGANFDIGDFAMIVKGAEFQFGNEPPAGRTTVTLDPSKPPKWIGPEDVGGADLDGRGSTRRRPVDDRGRQ